MTITYPFEPAVEIELFTSGTSAVLWGRLPSLDGPTGALDYWALAIWSQEHGAVDLPEIARRFRLAREFRAIAEFVQDHDEEEAEHEGMGRAIDDRLATSAYYRGE